jgi:hypothetical protein
LKLVDLKLLAIFVRERIALLRSRWMLYKCDFSLDINPSLARSGSLFMGTKAILIRCAPSISSRWNPGSSRESRSPRKHRGVFFSSRNGGPKYSTGDDSRYPGSYPLHPEYLKIAKPVIAYQPNLGEECPKSLREIIEMYWERLEDTVANENTNGPLDYLGEPK